MIKTVLFDMDGVIVDTEPVHHYAYFKLFEELGIVVPEDLYSEFTGLSTKNTFQKLKDIFKINYSIEDLVKRKRILFNEAFDNKEDLQLLEGVEELIMDLHKNGMQMILASSASKETIDRVFLRFGLYPYFSYIVSGEDFPKSKPDPAIFNHAASLSVASKQNCVIIEDSTNGVIAAKAADICCIGYKSSNSKDQNLSKADYRINNFNELNFIKIQNIKSF